MQAWRASLDSTDPRRLALIGELRRALERDELVLHYQPKVALQAAPGRDRAVGAVTGVEALVRWQHPVEDLLHADEFLPMAERTGLIVPLTAVVMRLALSQCRRLARRRAAHPGRGQPLGTRPARPAAARHDRSGCSSTYELPERHADPGDHRELRHARRARARCRCSSGWPAPGSRCRSTTSAPATRHWPTCAGCRSSEVKIDKSFVQDMAVDESDAAIVETILGLARHLQLRVVAEGVEDERTRDRLASMGCDIAQGFLFSRPLPAERFTTWLAMREQPLRRGPIRSWEAELPGEVEATGHLSRRRRVRWPAASCPFSSVGRASPW